MHLLIMYRTRLDQFQKGQTLAEYGPILVAIAVLAYVAYQVVGNEMSSIINSVTAVF
jgi:hypothetical protein